MAHSARRKSGGRQARINSNVPPFANGDELGIHIETTIHDWIHGAVAASSILQDSRTRAVLVDRRLHPKSHLKEIIDSKSVIKKIIDSKSHLKEIIDAEKRD